jgi:hypothetical protein
MSKFLLNLLVQISKALVNSKIQFLIQKFFSSLSARPTLWPTRSLAQPAPLASLLSHRPKPTGRPKPLSPRVPLAYSQKYSFSIDSRLLFSAPSLYPPLTHGPRVSVPSSPPRRPIPVRNPPRRRFPALSLCASDAAKLLRPPLIISLLNPLQTEP